MDSSKAPRAWNVQIMQRPHQMGFSPSKSDSSLYIWQGWSGLASSLLYIDDLDIASDDQEKIDFRKSQLATSFEMKDLGDLRYFLGIEVICIPEGILINQRHNVLSMFFKFRMT